MLNKTTGEVIGEEIEEVMEVDVANNGMAIGRVLRIKVHMDIRKPIMRGITVCVGESNEGRWCPLTYEHLPDFCYVCGIIGHTDRTCEIKVGKNETKQYGADLRHYIPRRKGGWENAGGRGGAAWRSSHTSSRTLAVGSGSRGADGRSRSDAPTWKKTVAMNNVGGGNKEHEGGAEKVVEQGDKKEGKDIADGKNDEVLGHVHSDITDMHAMNVDVGQAATILVPASIQEEEGEKNEKVPRKFKCRARGAGKDGGDDSRGEDVGSKHRRDEEVEGEEGRKRSKVGSSEVHNTNNEAGLVESLSRH